MLVFCRTLLQAAAQVDHVSMLQNRILPPRASVTADYEHHVEETGTQAECGGKTKPGSTKWEQLNDNQICVNVDTSSCGFTERPKYFPSLGGEGQKHTEAHGVSVVYLATVKSFKACVGYSKITPDDANEWKWHVTWVAFGEASKPRPAGTFVCYSRSHVDIERQPYVKELKVYETFAKIGKWEHINNTVWKMEVSTAHCGFIETPIYVVRLTSDHIMYFPTWGAESVVKPHATGFTVYIHRHPTNPNPAINWKLKNWDRSYTINFAAFGKVSHSKKPEWPWVRYYPKSEVKWTITPGLTTGYKEFPKMKECHISQGEFARHTMLISWTCPDDQFDWNQTNLGVGRQQCTVVMSQGCDPINRPKPDRYTGTVSTKAYEKRYRNCDWAVLHQKMGPGLPTPPPTPPTMAPPTMAPTAAPTPSPTDMPTTASPTAAPARSCCDV